MSQDDKKRPTVYFDGDCPMCRSFVPMVDEPEKEGSVKFENLRTADLPNDIKYNDAERKMHIVTEDGQILKGAKAVFKALEINNKYPWLVKIGRLPIIRSIAEVVYVIIAKNRFLLFDPVRKLSRVILSALGVISLILLAIYFAS